MLLITGQITAKGLFGRSICPAKPTMQLEQLDLYHGLTKKLLDVHHLNSHPRSGDPTHAVYNGMLPQ